MLKSSLNKALRFMLKRNADVVEVNRQDHTEYELDTAVGNLRVASGQGKIICQFDDPTLARSKVLCNAHTGKWNIYQKQDESAEEFIREFEKDLKVLLE